MTVNSSFAIFLASIGALGTALLAQYWGGLIPCELCMAQRWPYVATAILGLSAALLPLDARQRAATIGLAALIFLVGSGIAVYHAGFEYDWWTGPGACTAPSGQPKTLEELRQMLASAPIVACNRPAWTFYGVSMAGFNAAASLILAVVTARAGLKLWRNAA